MDIYFDQSLNRKLSVVKLSKQTLGCPPSLLERAVITDNSADCFPSSRVHPCNAQQRQTLMAADTFLKDKDEVKDKDKDKDIDKVKVKDKDKDRNGDKGENRTSF